MPTAVEEMRQRLHELAEAGEIQEAIAEAARHYGFSKLKVNDPGPDAINFSVEVFDIDGQFYAVEDTLCIGAYVIPMYERLATHNIVPVGDMIDFNVSHEAGHTGRGAEYSADELMNAQRQSGIDIRSFEAKVQRESIANQYSFEKCREGRSEEEFLELLSMKLWQGTFYPAYFLLEVQPGFDKDQLSIVAKDEKELSEMAYNHAEHSGYQNLMEPEKLEEIVGKVIEIDKNYRSKICSN